MGHYQTKNRPIWPIYSWNISFCNKCPWRVWKESGKNFSLYCIHKHWCRTARLASQTTTIPEAFIWIKVSKSGALITDISLLQKLEIQLYHFAIFFLPTCNRFKLHCNRFQPCGCYIIDLTHNIISWIDITTWAVDDRNSSAVYTDTYI